MIDDATLAGILAGNAASFVNEEGLRRELQAIPHPETGEIVLRVRAELDPAQEFVTNYYRINRDLIPLICTQAFGWDRINQTAQGAKP